MARLAVPICLMALLAGCGGGGGDDDKQQAEQTVRDFVKAVNTRDADSYCDDLITKEFREKTTFATGDRASESCKREFGAIRGLHIRLVRIVGTKVDGDKATVTAVLGRSGQELKQQLKLRKEDGDWKLAGGAEG
jgi:ketosteroid isomerase-like protein